MNATTGLVCFFLALGGGLFLCAVSIAAKRDRRLADIPRWTLGLVGLLGGFVTLWGALGLTAFYYSAHLTARLVDTLHRCRTLCGGVAVGLLLAWWISGQMKPFFKKRAST